jgi:hypothetical protein
VRGGQIDDASQSVGLNVRWSVIATDGGRWPVSGSRQAAGHRAEAMSFDRKQGHTQGLPYFPLLFLVSSSCTLSSSYVAFVALTRALSKFTFVSHAALRCLPHAPISKCLPLTQSSPHSFVLCFLPPSTTLVHRVMSHATFNCSCKAVN